MMMSSFVFMMQAAAQMPAIQWQRTLGGNANDQLYDLILTADGGYISVGRSESGAVGDKTEPSRGGTDIWVIKLAADGSTQWQKTIGANANDHAANIIQTSDGGYALGGFSSGGITGDRTVADKGYVDYWILKLNATGTIQWQKTYGGITEANQAYTFIQTPDDGFLLGGMSTGFKGPPGNKTEDPKGNFDYWMVKTDASGNLQWDKTIGGNEWDQMNGAANTSDGGYIVGGWSESDISADKTEPLAGVQDTWILKLDNKGKLQWQKTLGGNASELPNHMLQQTIDGGYIAGSTSQSGISGNRTEAALGGNDFWLVKLNPAGAVSWQKAIGGSGDDVLENGYQTGDKGYLLAGHSTSGISGNKTLASAGKDDWWVVKTDEQGAIVWQWALGGSGNDVLKVVHATGDGGYILGGYSESGISGNKSEKNRGGADFWIVKLGPQTPVPGFTNCRGKYNKAWLVPAKDDINNYNYTWEDYAGKQLQLHTTITGDTIYNLAPGKYSVNMQNNFGIDTTIAFEIKPDDYKASFTAGTICGADSFKIINTSTNHFSGYQWDFGDGSNSTQTFPVHAYSQSGNYNITLISATVKDNCFDTTSLTVTANNIPSIVAANDVDTICAGKSILLKAVYSEAIANYYWSFGDGNTSTAIEPLKTFSTAGLYQIKHWVMSTKGCASDTVENTIKVNASPVVKAGADRLSIAGESVKLEGSTTDISFPVSWTPAIFLSDSSTLKPMAKPPVSTEFYLTAKGEGSCTSADTVLVTVVETIRVPNAFSPNRDGLNDVWNIPGLSSYQNSKTQIFNRWGQMVFESKGYGQPWNGSFKGNPLPVGVYFYIINLGTDRQPINGSVTILR